MPTARVPHMRTRAVSCYTLFMAASSHSSGFSLPYLGKIEEMLHYIHEEHGVKFPGVGFMILFPLVTYLFYTHAPAQSRTNFDLTLFLTPLWVPLILGRFAFSRWLEMRRANFISIQAPLLLEIRLPRENRKSPLAMEAALSSLHLGPSEGTWYKRWYLGQVRPWWSLEIASLEGQVHFYVWTWKKMRRSVESYLYAQYPGIEITEVPDYTRLIDPNHEPYRVWGTEFKHTKPDPYPIKTYIDYGLDKQPAPKPEEQVDPLAQVIEFMGSIGKHQQLWLHFMIRVTKSEKYAGMRNAQGKKYTWKDAAREEVMKIRAQTVNKNRYRDVFTGEMRETEGFPNPTKGQSETMAAIERNAGKLGFDVGIRIVYISHKDHHIKAIGGFLTNILKVFESEIYNGFRPAPRWSEEFQDFPWEDFRGIRQRARMHELIEVTRRRSYFHEPYRAPWLIMSTEELATMYHVPGSTVKTPTLPRIQSATSEAPANLPT